MKEWMNERSFQEWYQAASKDDIKLFERVEDFSYLFEDMVFSNGTPTHEFIKCQSKLVESDEWIDDEVPLPEEIEYFSYTFFTYHIANLEGFSGCFNRKDYSLSVGPFSIDDDSVVLHEMIHLHEFVINDLPMFYHDAVLYCLYRDLSHKITDLNERIEAHGHILNSSQIAETGGVHDILFLLKSFDLDLKMGYKLGTVFGYGMANEWDTPGSPLEAAGEELPVFVTRAVETQAQRDALSRKMKGGKANE